MVDCASEPLGRFCGMGGIFRNGICWCVAVGLVVEKGDFDCCVCRVVVLLCCAALAGVRFCGVAWLRRCVVSQRVLCCFIVWR